MSKFGVAFYKDGKYEGQVAREAKVKDKEDARLVAKRWRDAHGGKHDYRAVEFNDSGYLIWEDEG